MTKDNIGKYFVVRGARPHTREQEPERVYITINGCFPYSIGSEGAEQLRQGFKEDAEKLFQALMSLPGGTFCQLLVLMLQEKASQFIVSHKPTAEYRKMEAVDDLFKACEAALTYFEQCVMSCDPEDEETEEATILRKALARARGESEGQDG